MNSTRRNKSKFILQEGLDKSAVSPPFYLMSLDDAIRQWKS